jgi:hypothetical protein
LSAADGDLVSLSASSLLVFWDRERTSEFLSSLTLRALLVAQRVRQICLAHGASVVHAPVCGVASGAVPLFMGERKPSLGHAGTV